MRFLGGEGSGTLEAGGFGGDCLIDKLGSAVQIGFVVGFAQSEAQRTGDGLVRKTDSGEDVRFFAFGGGTSGAGSDVNALVF